MSVVVRVEKRGGASTAPLFGIVELTQRQRRRWDGEWRVVVAPPARAIGVGLTHQYWRYRFHHLDTVSAAAEAIAPGSAEYIELWETGLDGPTRTETLVLRLDAFGLRYFTTGMVQIHTGSGQLYYSDHGDFRGPVHWNTVISTSPVP